ncbi:MAG: hypothetical protein ACI867_001398 [Glaciecola sp.]|jgi:hypothetical protein
MADMTTMTIGYACDPETVHAKQYVTHLTALGATVRVHDVDALPQMNLDGLDVLIVDADPRGRDGVMRGSWRQPPVGLTLDTFTVPTIVVGTFGSFLSESLGTKLGAAGGCWCLDEHAYVYDRSHPVWAGIDLDNLIEVFPTPEHHLSHDELDVPATLDRIEIVAVPQDVAGQVSFGGGFLDSPDTDLIAGGTNTKTHEHFSIARHGRFLQWGFAGTPEDWTAAGKTLFANCLAYIAEFADADIQAFRATGPRSLLQNKLGYEVPWDNLPASMLEQFKASHFGGMFGDDVPAQAKLDRTERMAWLHDNLEYVSYAGVEGIGHWFIDQDVQIWGVSNREMAVLDRCLAEADDVAGRVWQRYTGRSFDDVEVEAAWLAQHRDHLWFTDWGGYRWVSSLEANNPLPPRSEPVRSDLFQASMAARRNDGGAVVAIDLLISPTHFAYPPGSDEGLPITVTVADGSPFSMAGDLRVHADQDGHLRDSSNIRFDVQGDGGLVEVDLRVQLCDDNACLPPTVLRLTAPVISA